MRISVSILPLCLALVACGTPQEQCIARETRDLRIINRLIAETEGNLQRGYAFEEITISRPVWVQCAPLPVRPAVEGQPAPPPQTPRRCLDDEEETVTRPKAIDLSAEQSKLNGLKAKRKQLSAAAERSIAACRKAYPE
jgi:hypothetical protein